MDQLREQSDQVLEEIARRIKGGQIPADKSIEPDDQFLRELDIESQGLLEKEKDRHKIAQEAAEIEAQVIKDRIMADEQANTLRIKECDIKYQQNQHSALKNELERASGYYEQVLQDVRNKVDSEKENIAQLESEVKDEEQELEELRQEVAGLRREVNQKREYKTNESGNDLDLAIRNKLEQVEEAEERRRDAQIELDELYDVWRTNLDDAMSQASSKLQTDEDRRQISQIKKLIVENDKLARTVNALLQDKEELENQIYIESTKNKISDTLDNDIENINSKITEVQREDRELMEQLDLSDKALDKKDKTILELDARISTLRDHLAGAENDVDSKRQSIRSLTSQISSTRAEIDRLRNMPDTDYQALEAEVADLEGQIGMYEREVVEKGRDLGDWEEKYRIKQDIIRKRSHQIAPTFVPVHGDPLDQYIADLISQESISVPVSRQGPNRYLYGTRNLIVEQEYNGEYIVVTKRGERLPLEDFFSRYHDEELRKLEHMKAGEEIVVDENDNADYRKSAVRAERPREDDHDTDSHYGERASNFYRDRRGF